MSDDLLVRVEGGIAHVTFNRPQARNALTFAMYDRLEQFCAEAARTPDLRAIILAGAGGEAFAAGTDISQFRAFSCFNCEKMASFTSSRGVYVTASTWMM